MELLDENGWWAAKLVIVVQYSLDKLLRGTQTVLLAKLDRRQYLYLSDNAGLNSDRFNCRWVGRPRPGTRGHVKDHGSLGAWQAAGAGVSHLKCVVQVPNVFVATLTALGATRPVVYCGTNKVFRL